MMHINSLVSKLNLKDPWSAITHGIAMLLAIAGTAPLLLRAASGENAERGEFTDEEIVVVRNKATGEITRWRVEPETVFNAYEED